MKLPFKFQSRWDFDWFRMEPKIFDFYFCARVVSNIGDKTYFSYLINPLLEKRFKNFLKAYNQANPLSRNELNLLKEVYRFFILNYVVKDGASFFRSEIYQRLITETISSYLPEIDSYPDYSELF